MPYDKQLRDDKGQEIRSKKQRATANPGQGEPRAQVMQVLAFAAPEHVR
jgi:hypothetical protein